jgi:hypothetical protein
MTRRKQITFNLWYLALFILLAGVMVRGVFAADSFREASTLGGVVLVLGFIPMRLLRLQQLLWPRSVVGMDDSSATINLRESFAERSCSIIVGLGMLAAGGLPLLGFGGPDLPIVFPVALLAMGALVIAYGLLTKREHLTLSPDGIDWSQIKPHFMPWIDVKSSGVRRWLLFSAMAVVEVRGVGKYFRKGKLKRTSSQCFGILPFLFGLDAETLAKAIALRRARFSDPQPSSTGNS